MLQDEDTETYSEAVERVGMLFGLSVTSSDILCAEATPNTAASDSGDSMRQVHSTAAAAASGPDAGHASHTSESGPPLVLLVGVAVAIAAVAAAAFL